MGAATVCYSDSLCKFACCQDSALSAPPRCTPGFPFCSLSVSELEIALNMDPAAFQTLYCAEKPKLEDKNLIFFCQMGRRGLQATQLAQGLGYTGARNYAGAYKEWLEKQG